MQSFLFINQREQKDCGISCLQMIAHYYDKEFNVEEIIKLSDYDKDFGTSLLGMYNAALLIGLNPIVIKISYDDVKNIKLPVIAVWSMKHYVVIPPQEIVEGKGLTIADPAFNKLVVVDIEIFKKFMLSENNIGHVICFDI